MSPDGADAAGGRRARRTWAARIALTVAAVLAAAGAVVGCQVLADGLSSCFPPSDRELREQQDFVVAHLPDARDFSLGTSDCDDHGEGYGYFTTDLTPKTARAALLADPACSSFTAPDSPGDITARCRSGTFTVLILLEIAEGGRTRGSLTIR